GRGGRGRRRRRAPAAGQQDHQGRQRLRRPGRRVGRPGPGRGGAGAAADGLRRRVRPGGGRGGGARPAPGPAALVALPRAAGPPGTGRVQERRGAEMTEIRAEMAASVYRVTAAPGDRVAAGATLFLLESMKMEIPVLTEEPGTVVGIGVAEGDVVHEGDLLAVVE